MSFWKTTAQAALSLGVALGALPAVAKEPVKIGVLAPLTGTSPTLESASVNQSSSLPTRPTRQAASKGAPSNSCSRTIAIPRRKPPASRRSS